ncbi:hypothetical protein CC86DRAFT_372590 [Ophiobolus disseminans]|uniref:Uncharacterized protein n=1 Tax=Ophiobolus disseminans TaxID=1469910 RepID=A0A6A6ZR38_9PLEO|nr:hypothetical protein CC86DRAFT_372590 [Ophiobolus disseminans]
MKPEALDAIATQTMRPSALDAATARDPDDGAGKVGGTNSENERPCSPATPKQPSTPFGQRIAGTQSAAKVVEEVAHGVKVAVDTAIAWAEKKVDALGSESDSAGPYASTATCVPSDLDPIAAGVIPAVTTQREKDLDKHEQSETDRVAYEEASKKAEDTKKEMRREEEAH